jgi:5,10-methylenetetrahydrofolate reductase
MRAVRLWSSRHARTMEVLYTMFEGVARICAPVVKKVPSRYIETPIKLIEKPLKELMFDCRMCGQCILSSTGMACPMNCPKNLRNGPCGGVREGGGCEVYPDMRCVWLEAWDGAARMHRRSETIHDLMAPAPAQKKDHSTFLPLLKGEKPYRTWDVMTEGTLPPKPARGQGPAVSDLQRILRTGVFTVTCEFNPPNTFDPELIASHAAVLEKVCDAVNVTDSAGAKVHISSIATCAILAGRGHEPVMQMTCRDRNRIAVQADILGASALGLRNVLCMTGDDVGGGDHPDSKPVFELDASSLLATIRHMRDHGKFISGKELDGKPPLFLGATANPTAQRTDIEIARLTKKVEAGAQFIQSQFVYDLERFDRFMVAYRAAGLHERCYLLIGVGPLNSAKSANWMRRNIAGMVIPDAVIARIEAAADQKAEGLQICVETIDHLRGFDGVSGVHVMAIGRAQAIVDIVDAATIGPKYRT